MPRLALDRFHAPDRPQVTVKARGALAAAKKLYRMRKNYYGAASRVIVADEFGATQTFSTRAWCQPGQNKFKSKPKPPKLVVV